MRTFSLFKCIFWPNTDCWVVACVTRNMINKCAKFHGDTVKKLSSISRARLNFRRRPVLCTSLYKHPIQASDFGGTFANFSFDVFVQFSHKMPLLLPYHGGKAQKWPKTPFKGAVPLTLLRKPSCDDESSGSVHFFFSIPCALAGTYHRKGRTSFAYDSMHQICSQN